VTLAQFAVLNALVTHSPTSVTGLAERTGMNRSWLSRTIHTLATLGYVSRASSPTDGRRADVGLTAKGRALLADHEARR
jgi:DNA-binding MarR family transcriptional regulator